MTDTKKLLRFGTDEPRCAKCGSTDWRALCQIPARKSQNAKILCRNCRTKTQPSRSVRSIAWKMREYEQAGYFEPACVICHEPSQQILELDHLAGKANSIFTEPLCANHHAIKSYAAEHGPMAKLRHYDPKRTALAFEAAFDFGLAAILGGMAAVDGGEHVARAIFLGLAAAALAAWGIWNLAADDYFANVLGPGYDRGILATVPQ